MAIQQQVNLKTRTGNKCAVMFGGIQIGLLQSVRMNDDYSPEPASGIGDIHVQEWVPTMARHNISIQAMVLNVGEMISAGVAAENGDAMLLGLRSFPRTVLGRICRHGRKIRIFGHLRASGKPHSCGCDVARSVHCLEG